MTSSMNDLQEAIGKTISQFGLNVYESARDAVVSPAAVVIPHEIDFMGAMALGGDTYMFDIAVLVARTDTKSSQRRLNEYLTGKGPKSIREFLHRNSSLGLPDVDCIVEKMRGYGGNYDTGPANFVGAVLRLRVTVD